MSGNGLAPGFFVAVPFLADPNFAHRVVLLLEQNDDGAIGVIVNADSPLTLAELCNDHELPYQGDPEKKVRDGGPVQPEQGLVLFGAEHRDEESKEIIDGLYVSASKDTLGRLCGLDEGRFHIYSGYAGWGPGQLEREIGEGTWIIVPPDAETVLDTPPDQIWERVLRRAGIDPASIVPGGGAEA